MSKSRPSNSERGMSLIEVLIAITLFVIIILAALLLYDRSNRVFKTGVEAADTQQNTRVAFDKIATDLRMAGYDYDRDGVPAGSSGGVNWFQQPDEQIEHAGVSSITIRANFDAETSGPENGRETAQETSSGGHFPVVTTGNDEIVTYALESADASKNDDSIFFYADVPDRKSFPGAGGRNENLVTITGVDLSNANPPYTLYRYTLDPGLGAITVVRTPLASNIRSLRFEYFEDPGAARQLTDLSSTPVNITEAVDSTGGVGQFNPNVGTAVPLRAIRAKIQSVRMTLIGMNESFDSSYQDPNEATGVAVFGAPGNITSQNYRKFRLQSIIVPRNYQKSGLKEQETAPPGAPTITRVCIGYCGLAYVEWDSPVVNASQGSPEDYQILYGATSTTVTNIGAIVGIANSGFVTVPDPSATYYFSVKAVNSFGSTPSPTQGVFGPVNATKPSVPDMAAFDPSTNPDGFRISGGGGGQPAPQANQISLEWSMPTTNASGSITCPFGGGSGPATDVREIAGYRLSRNAGSASFNPGDSGVIDVATVGTNIPIDPITGRALFIDTTAANCVDYYYKIQQIERCQSPASYNAGSDASLSFSAVSSAILGRAESIIQPKAPTDLVIVTANSSCNSSSPFECTQVEMSWPRVEQDINNVPVTIAEYEVTRRKLNGANSVVESNTIIVNESNALGWGANIVWRDTDTAALTRPDNAHKFEYEVRAKGLCTGTPLSGPSPARVYPCTFVGGSVTVDMTNRFEGTGTSSDPWLVQTPAALNITTGASVKQIRAIVNPGNVLLGDTGVGSFSTASFPWPGGLASGQTYQINISIEDMGGCVTSATRYVEEYAFNCCVVPVTIDSSIRQLDGPSGIEKFRLINICNSPLQLTTTGGGVETTWERDALTGSGGSDKLTRNFFPTSLPQNPPTGVNTIGGGGDNEGTRIYQPQGGQIASVPVDSTGIADDYYVQFQYSKSFAPTFAPTQNLCIKYRIGGVGALRSCRIYPDVSTSPDSCN